MATTTRKKAILKMPEKTKQLPLLEPAIAVVEKRVGGYQWKAVQVSTKT